MGVEDSVMMAVEDFNGEFYASQVAKMVAANHSAWDLGLYIAQLVETGVIRIEGLELPVSAPASSQ